MEQIKMICPYCKKEFILKRHQYYDWKKHPEIQKFCSNHCASKWKGENIYKKQIKLDNAICVVCKKEFQLSPTQQRAKDQNNQHEFCCSRNCQGYWTHSKIDWTETCKKIANAHNKKTKEEKQNIIKKTKQTKLERYGNENYTNIKAMQDTMLKRYGATTSLGSEIIKSKIQQTNLEKYGFITPAKNEKIKEKINTSIKNKLTNNVPITSQINMNKDTYDILHDAVKLELFIKSIPKDTRHTDYIADKLNIGNSTLLNYMNKYKLHHLINRHTSKAQKEIIDFIKEYYKGDIITNDRDLIRPNEIDIYIPERNLAIEYNGLYFHTLDKVKDKKYHYNKSCRCEEKGVRLIHIWSNEWKDKRQQPILKNIIKNALGVNDHKIYARNLDIQVLESKNMKEFFEQNNIQGFRGGKFAICLCDKITNKPYMSYIFGNAYFGKGKYQWEVIRGATELGYTVVGGASKIWKYFKDNYNPDNCVYYVDYNYFNGNSICKLDKFELVTTQFSFKNYFESTDTLKNRDPVHNKEIKELYKIGEVSPIYNAGTKVYVWKKEINV